jgi:hypothetical protein
MKAVLIVAALAALTADAAMVRVRGPRNIPAPTDPYEVEGVEMPPRYTEEEWAKRQDIVAEFNRMIGELDNAIYARWLGSLTQEQKDALDLQKRKLKEAQEKRNAEARRREWECEHIVKRDAWVKSEARTARRIEREFHPGLKWMDSDLVKETITIGESGKVKIHILYTADGKRHRFDPESVERELREKASAGLLETIIKED